MIDDNSGLGLTSSFDMGVSRLSRCKLAKFDMTVEQRSPLGYEQWRSRRMKEKKKRLLMFLHLDRFSHAPRKCSVTSMQQISRVSSRTNLRVRHIYITSSETSPEVQWLGELGGISFRLVYFPTSFQLLLSHPHFAPGSSHALRQPRICEVLCTTRGFKVKALADHRLPVSIRRYLSLTVVDG